MLDRLPGKICADDGTELGPVVLVGIIDPDARVSFTLPKDAPVAWGDHVRFQTDDRRYGRLRVTHVSDPYKGVKVVVAAPDGPFG